MSVRTLLKRSLAVLPDRGAARGVSILIYHRVGGGTRDEMDTDPEQFGRHLDLLTDSDVIALDDAVDRLTAGDERPGVVLTFDDGFADVYTNAWPLLRERGLPFTVYVAGGLIGSTMRWEGSVGSSQGGPAMSWAQVAEMHASGLCTVGNHTYSHVRPGAVDEDELDRCSDVVEMRLGVRPTHFAWTWGIPVPPLRQAVARRFKSAVTGDLGRNRPGDDVLALRRIPVRRTDPLGFFKSKLHGDLVAERAYGRLVAAGRTFTSRAR